MTELRLLALIFCTSCLAVLAIHHMFFARKETIKHRLENVLSSQEKDEIQEVGTGKKLSPLALATRWALKIKRFKKLARSFDTRLTDADVPLKSEEFLVLVSAATAFFWVLAAIYTGNILLSATLIIFVPLIASFWLKSKAQRRLTRFDQQICDALVIMSNSLRSGFSFLQTMDLVRKELPPPISQEFGRAFQEMNLGTPTEEALINLMKRVKSQDLELVITAVLIQRQVGGNLAEVLDNIASTIRERVRIKGEIKTLTAQGRASGFVIGLLPVGIAAVLMVINPSYLMPLVTKPGGIMALSLAVGMEIVGIILIKRIVNIQV